MEKTLIKVLVVDDDPALRQLLADYLNRHGYDTLLSNDSHDLPTRIERYTPDLIVLD
ncbi:MAG TPA: two-component system response regulator OmpR, partial [Pusillimonas sp.]|nr:two-component system response regulator OmpR [Pusillimonas sp.]